MAESEVADARKQTPLFRSKKRKLYRQRQMSPVGSLMSGSGTAGSSPSGTLRLTASPGLNGDSDDSNGTSVTEILRLRKLRKHRVGGIEFRVASPAHNSTPQEMLPTGAQNEPEEQGGLDIGKKFVSQTGTTATGVDKHMMAYIDAELAKKVHLTATNCSNQNTSTIEVNTLFDKPRTEAPAASIAPVEQCQPTALGKIEEIDLASIPQPQRKPPSQDAGPKPKIRIGRNGKPYTPRERKRRNSEDIRRDALVEAVLQDTPLEYYDNKSTMTSASAAVVGEGEDADEAFAERFQKEYLQRAQEGQRKKVPPMPAQKVGYGKKVEEEILKGPKLGGSRSARASMRETMLKENSSRGRK